MTDSNAEKREPRQTGTLIRFVLMVVLIALVSSSCEMTQYDKTVVSCRNTNNSYELYIYLNRDTDKPADKQAELFAKGVCSEASLP